MALPTVKALEQCSTWSHVVAPYIPQLYELPSKFLASATSPGALLELYKSTNPLIAGFAISLAIGTICLVSSEVNRNWSQIDRLWSLLPAFYNVHFVVWANLHGLPTSKIELALFWSILWSARLTYNYAKKGGYAIGSEDYRWEIIRAVIPGWAFFIMNVTFISYVQSILLFGLSVPMYVLMLSSLVQPEVGTVDWAFVGAELALLAFETLCDEQMWYYQAAKQEYKKTGKVKAGYKKDDFERGFITSGFWAYSRHPNYVAEMSIWIVFYLHSCYASNSLYSWAGLGSAVFVSVILGSTDLTEQISRAKYPEYPEYQKQLNAFMPKARPYQPPAVKPTKLLGPEPGFMKAKVYEAVVKQKTA